MKNESKDLAKIVYVPIMRKYLPMLADLSAQAFKNAVMMYCRWYLSGEEIPSDWEGGRMFDMMKAGTFHIRENMIAKFNSDDIAIPKMPGTANKKRGNTLGQSRNNTLAICINADMRKRIENDAFAVRHICGVAKTYPSKVLQRARRILRDRERERSRVKSYCDFLREVMRSFGVADCETEDIILRLIDGGGDSDGKSRQRGFNTEVVWTTTVC